MEQRKYFNRDLSWLSFNERVLLEASGERVPLLEKIKFLSIFSSNLDEFYRVRIPALKALKKVNKKSGSNLVLEEVKEVVQRLQTLFGKLLAEQVLPQLKKEGLRWFYNEPLPEAVMERTFDYFRTRVLGFLQPVKLTRAIDFFPENNKLYLLLVVQDAGGHEELHVVNIPSEHLSRFLLLHEQGEKVILFLDDVIKAHAGWLFRNQRVLACYSFKVTRDAELDLKDEYEGDIAEKLERQLARRDYGLATRFLYDKEMPASYLHELSDVLRIKPDSLTPGGIYHNLKDLASFPLKEASLLEKPWPPVAKQLTSTSVSLLERVAQTDIILHPPYHSYDTVLQFFNEAATDPGVEEIYVTLYRVASESQIVQALMTAARNGKSVRVFVELKARFDEANNLKWARKMKAAGVQITYSIPTLKVHAKVALVKQNTGKGSHYTGLLGTGNFNENTARFYTDHILLTSHKEMLKELERLFIFLGRRIKPPAAAYIHFNHLLVAGFNLSQGFHTLIEREIEQAKQGLPASISIKLNNLEEKSLIDALYRASEAGVKIRLLVRSICCLVPGVEGLSSNIELRRIVDKYLEHGRIFIFHNLGEPEVFLGSADWMDRNIHRRIEVCFPVYKHEIRKELTELFELQWQDNVQAVRIDAGLRNVYIKNEEKPLRSQECIYRYIANKAQQGDG